MYNISLHSRGLERWNWNVPKHLRRPLCALNTQWAIVRSEYTMYALNTQMGHCTLWIHNGPLYALSTQWAIVGSEYTMGHCTLWIHNGPLYALSTQWAIVRSEYTVRRRRQTHWSNFILWVQNGPKTTLKSLSWWRPGVPVWFKTDCKVDPNVLHVRSLSPKSCLPFISTHRLTTWT